MQPVNLFALATQQSKWLAVRQSAIASNIANVNTPGYGAARVEDFEKVLDKVSVSMARTQHGHVGDASGSDFKIRHDDPASSLMPSKNTVVLEDELIDAGSVRRAFELNTAIVKAFQRMTLMATKT